MATVVKKHVFDDGDTLRLKKLASDDYSLTLVGSRLEDPMSSKDEAYSVFNQAIEDVKRGRASKKLHRNVV